MVSVYLLCGTALIADEPAGSRDYPLIERYPGSEIAAYAREAKASYRLPAGPLRDGKPDKTLPLTGVLTRITYHAPTNASAPEVYRFFAAELADAGFATLYAASGEQLSRYTDWSDAFYPDDHGVTGETINQHFIAAKRAQPTEIYAALYVAQGMYAYPVVQLDIIETKTPAQNKAKTASLLQRRIERYRYAVIPALELDEATGEVTAGSAKALQEIAETIAAFPQKHFYVVGHTDNAGGFSASMERSRRLADAVVRSLVSRYNVPAAQVTAQGVGPLCPVDETASVAGRRAGARVELVAP